jgi:hypothetical protein
MNGETLLALAERVEKASGPDRELDAEIWVRIHHPEYRFPGEVVNRRPSDWQEAAGRFNHDGYGGEYQRPAYTSSLDAAMTLLPPTLRLRGFGEGKSGIWTADVVERERGGRCIGIGSAATHALAITAACLRANAAGDAQ